MVSKIKEAVLNTLQKQYTYTNLSDLLYKKAELIDEYLGDLTSKFGKEVLNYNTCSSDALDYFWGQIFKINRNFKDNKGNTFTLTDEQFREVIKIRAFGTTWDGTISSVNLFLSNLFKDRGVAYALDPQNMSFQVFAFNFELYDWEKFLFENNDILPRPAGVSTQIKIVKDKKYFSFYTYDQVYEYPISTGFDTYANIQEGKFLTYKGDVND